jgi:putative membrane protein insertion efficiency factor
MTGPLATGACAGEAHPEDSGPRGSLLARLLIVPIRGYQLFISPALPPTCRFYPSCSAYAVEALRVHGAVKGVWLAVRRIGRCHPWHWSGYDPVPPRGVRRSGAERRALALTWLGAPGGWHDRPTGADDPAREPPEDLVGSSEVTPGTGGRALTTTTTSVRTRRAVAQPPSRSAGATATNAGSSAA